MATCKCYKTSNTNEMSKETETIETKSHAPLSGVKASLIHWLIDRTDDELAEIWVELNSWIFPSIIPTEFKPKWWDVESGTYSPKYNNEDRMVGFNHVIMAFCKASVDDDKIQAKWMELTNSL